MRFALSDTLNNKGRRIAAKNAGGPAQNRKFVALHIDLHKTNRVDANIIEPAAADRDILGRHTAQAVIRIDGRPSETTPVHGKVGMAAALIERADKVASPFVSDKTMS